MADLSERSREKDYRCLWGRGSNQGNENFLEKRYSQTALQWKTKSAERKDTLNTEIGKEKSVSARILLVILTKGRGKWDRSRTSRPSTVPEGRGQPGPGGGQCGRGASFLAKSSLGSRGCRHAVLRWGRIQTVQHPWHLTEQSTG